MLPPYLDSPLSAPRYSKPEAIPSKTHQCLNIDYVDLQPLLGTPQVLVFELYLAEAAAAIAMTLDIIKHCSPHYFTIDNAFFVNTPHI